jgi:outer membrane protein assembly factor BamB
MRARFPAVLFLSCLPPTTILAAQHASHPAIPVGARVKLDLSSGPGTEGILLAWRGDTLVVKAADRNDTIRVRMTELSGIRVMDSPALWGDTMTADINFYVSAAVPRSAGSDSGEDIRYRRVLLVATGTSLAGLDPTTGRTLWTRTDLADLKWATVDFVGRTGYGVVTRGDTMEVLDLRSGQKRWDTRALSFTAARGWLPLGGPDTAILMLGRTAESPATLSAVELATGKVRWRQDHLFGIEPKVFRTSGVPYLLGHQDPLSDSDSTLILYISPEGPLRLDARSGALLWRSSDVHSDKVPAPRDGYAWMRERRGVIFVPTEKQVAALRVADGHPAWDAPHAFKSQVIDMGWTPRGLLVRGDEWIDLLDPTTGKSLWHAPVEVKHSTRMVIRGDTIYIRADKKLLAIQVTDGSVRTLATLKFEQGEEPGGFAVFPEGIVLNSWHHVTQFDRQGLQRNHGFYPSPKENFGEALSGAATGIGARRPVTMWGGQDIYFFTGAPNDRQVQGFSLVKFDPAAWREDGRIWFAKRVPDYLIEWSSGMAYHEPGSRELIGLTFGDWSAMETAMQSGIAQVTALLDMGADPNVVGPSGWSPLHSAAAHGQADIARLLLARGGSVDARTRDGWTPWMVAAAHGHADVVQLLQDAGARHSDATATLVHAWSLTDQGHIADAVSAITAVQASDSGNAIFPATWRQLCWSGVLHDAAAAVRPACEQAIQHTPRSDPNYATTLLARGIARALSGDLVGAADDIAASERPTWDDDEERNLAAWIDALRAGTNPFTPKVLAVLR